MNANRKQQAYALPRHVQRTKVISHAPAVERHRGWRRESRSAPLAVMMGQLAWSPACCARRRHPRDGARFGIFGCCRQEPAGPLRAAGRSPRQQHDSPLPRSGAGRDDDLMRGADRDRGARRRAGVGGPCRLGTAVSWLCWAVATVGLHSAPLTAHTRWWLPVPATAPGPLHQLRGDPRAAPRVRTRSATGTRSTSWSRCC